MTNPKIAVLASGSGSTVEAFIHATQAGKVSAEVVLVICNNPPEKAGVYDRIERLNQQYGLSIEMVEMNGRIYPDPDGQTGRGQTLSESEAIYNKVIQAGCGHVALMGYMKVVRGKLVEQFGWRSSMASIYEARMSNTHPGPLPETSDTFGIHTSEKVLELGLSASKHTVHLVAEGIDTGPIIAEHIVEVLPGDTAETLFARAQSVEKESLPIAINNFLREQAEYFS